MLYLCIGCPYDIVFEARKEMEKCLSKCQEIDVTGWIASLSAEKFLDADNYGPWTFEIYNLVEKFSFSFTNVK